MPIALSLWFEDTLENAVRDVWLKLKRHGIASELYDGRFRPHVTVGVWDVPNLSPLVDKLTGQLAKTSPFPIRFESIGLFPGKEGVVFYAPVVNSDLISLHSSISDLADQGCAPASIYYRPGYWVPHCTVACKISESEVLNTAQVCLQNSKLPLEGRVTSLGVILTPEEKELHKIELCG